MSKWHTLFNLKSVTPQNVSPFSENLAEKTTQLFSVVLLSFYQTVISKAKEHGRKLCCLDEYQSLPTFSQTVSAMCSSHSNSWGFFPSKIIWSMRLWAFPMVSHSLRNSCKEVRNISRLSLPQKLHSGCSWPSMPHLPSCAHLGDALQHKLCPKPCSKPWMLQWWDLITLMARSWPLYVTCAVK